MDAVIFTYTCCFNIPALVILKECSGGICGSLASVSTNSVMDSYIAAVTFNHLAIFPKGRDTIRTCHSAAVTADTVSGIVNCKVGLRIFAQTGAWAGGNARRIATVHAG